MWERGVAMGADDKSRSSATNNCPAPTPSPIKTHWEPRVTQEPKPMQDTRRPLGPRLRYCISSRMGCSPAAAALPIDSLDMFLPLAAAELAESLPEDSFVIFWLDWSLDMAWEEPDCSLDMACEEPDCSLDMEDCSLDMLALLDIVSTGKEGGKREVPMMPTRRIYQWRGWGVAAAVKWQWGWEMPAAAAASAHTFDGSGSPGNLLVDGADSSSRAGAG